MSKKPIILDIEASGLSPRSYPVEIGWASVQDLSGDSFLIRPSNGWVKNGDWSSTSEQIHGISLEQALDEGIPVAEAAERVNEALNGYRVLVDGGQYDPQWYRSLFNSAGIQPAEGLFSYENALRKRVDISGASALVVETNPETQFRSRLERVNAAVRACYDYPHRAGPDAKFLAARFRAMIDESFLLRIETDAEKQDEYQCKMTRAKP